jgi:anti-sigma factor RsiW
MKCAWIEDRILLFLTGELRPDDSARVTAHLENCESCTSVMEDLAESLDTLRETVRTTALPPESLDACIMQRIQALPKRAFSWPFRSHVWSTRETIAFAACALILVFSGYRWGQWTAEHASSRVSPTVAAMGPRLDMTTLAQAHRSWGSHTAAGIANTERMAERLTRETGMTVTPLEIKESDFRLKEGDVLQMSHVPVAAMHYDWKGTSVTLAQADGTRLIPPIALRKMKDHGHCYLVQRTGDLTSVLWCEGTRSFVLMAHLPPAQLFTLACEVCTKLQKKSMTG